MSTVRNIPGIPGHIQTQFGMMGCSQEDYEQIVNFIQKHAATGIDFADEELQALAKKIADQYAESPMFQSVKMLLGTDSFKSAKIFLCEGIVHTSILEEQSTPISSIQNIAENFFKPEALEKFKEIGKQAAQLMPEEELKGMFDKIIENNFADAPEEFKIQVKEEALKQLRT